MRRRFVSGPGRWSLNSRSFLLSLVGWVLLVLSVYSGLSAVQFGDDGYLTYMVVLGVVAAVVLALKDSLRMD